MPKLMIIDDSPTICAIVRMLFERQSWEVETYQDPLPALKALCEASSPPPTVVVLDLQLPHMDGYEVAQAIRTQTPGHVRTVPIICLSHKDRVLDRVKMKLVGMNTSLAKPFLGADLLRLVHTFC